VTSRQLEASRLINTPHILGWKTHFIKEAIALKKQVKQPRNKLQFLKTEEKREYHTSFWLSLDNIYL